MNFIVFFRNLQEALESMRHIAMLINERKRKLESVEKLAEWQSRVEDWEVRTSGEISNAMFTLLCSGAILTLFGNVRYKCHNWEVRTLS